MASGFHLPILCMVVLFSGCGCPRSRGAAPQLWEPHVSKHCAFTLLKPAGWKVSETYVDRPRMWGFTVSAPGGDRQLSSFQSVTSAGQDNLAAIRKAVDGMSRQLRGFTLAPSGRRRDLELQGAGERRIGTKTLVVLEGGFVDARGRKWQFRSMISCGGGLLLHQRIEAEHGRLDESAPILLQTLANLRVAKGLFSFDEGGAALAEPPSGGHLPLVPRRLASGWATLGVPAGWKVADLGKGACLASDPDERWFFLVGGAEFVAPRYFVSAVPGVLASDFRPPADAFAFSASSTGQATQFEFQFVKPRQDLLQVMRASAGPLRPVAVEDFAYTCRVKGRPYRGFSTGGCSGDAVRASWRLWHFTLMAPQEEFEAALPTLAAVLGSYELNQEMAGKRMADNLRNYYAGLRDLGNQIARNSEQMRRENLEGFMERGRVQDYISYQTTRMIMGEFDYLAGASGYVRGSASGLHTADGTQITSEPYGESITRGMQEINCRELFLARRP